MFYHLCTAVLVYSVQYYFYYQVLLLTTLYYALGSTGTSPSDFSHRLRRMSENIGCANELCS